LLEDVAMPEELILIHQVRNLKNIWKKSVRG
jgi:hypothetical protein